MAQAKHKTTRSAAWETGLRAMLRGAHGTRWSVRSIRGRTQITARYGDGTRAAVSTDIPWAGPSATAILALVGRLDPLVLDGMPLADAHRRITTGAVGPGGAIRWAAVIEAFRTHKTESGAVSARTWGRMYQPAMDLALGVLSAKRPPRDGKSLLAAVAKQQGLPPGARGRQTTLQYVAAMLRFAVEEEGLPSIWAPPASLTAVVGKALEQRGHTTPIKDGELLSLLACINDPQLRLTLGLMGVFGLRPWEVWESRVEGQKLAILRGKRTSHGHGKTRTVTGLDPVGRPGLAGELLSMLAERGAAGLPPRPPHGREGNRLRALLQKEPAWLNLVEVAAAEGRRLVPYSCRHGYALRGSLRGISIRTLAAQLGHNVATHTTIYGQWIDAESIDSELAAAAARLAVEQAVPTAA